MQPTERATGQVKWFSSEKGYGFISVDAGGDIFCHASQFEPDAEPVKLERVEFTPDRGLDGKAYARRIVILEGPR